MSALDRKNDGDNDSFADRLRLVYTLSRQRAQISQVDVAAMIALLEKSECTQPYVSKIENGGVVDNFAG